jgi:hypothetical protein
MRSQNPAGKDWHAGTLDVQTLPGRLFYSVMQHSGTNRPSVDSLTQRVGYRLAQFFRGVGARVSAAEEQQVLTILPASAVVLFRQLPVDAQRHSLNVLHTLMAAGFTHRELAMAALLHDVGKVAAQQAGFSFNPVWRGLLVLLETFFPQTLASWRAADPAAGWRYLLYVHIEHPQIGAEWARATGCPALACWLIEHHQDMQPLEASLEECQLLAALQWADNRN